MVVRPGPCDSPAVVRRNRVMAYAAWSGGSSLPGPAPRLAACASWSEPSRRPPPSHHGQGTSLRTPPRLEITRPVPRQAEQGTSVGVDSVAIAAARVHWRRGGAHWGPRGDAVGGALQRRPGAPAAGRAALSDLPGQQRL